MVKMETYDFCPACGATIPYGETACPQCGRSAIIAEDTESWSGRPDPRVRSPQRTQKPGIAGGLMVIMGLLAVAFGLLMLSELDLLIEVMEEQMVLAGVEASYASTYMYAMLGGSLLLGATSLIGGVLAIMRRYWWVAMISSVLLAMGGMLMLIPGIIGVVCVMLIAQSKQEFS